jgi:hypothetical protein
MVQNSVRKQRFAALPGIVGVVLITAGCTTTPRVNFSCNASLSPSSALQSAMTCSHDLVEKIKTRLQDHERTMSFSRIGLLGGAIGAGTGAVYRAPIDLITGLGLLAGTSYAVGNLYAPPPFLGIYDAGLGAAHCVHGVATKAAGTALTIGNRKKVLANSINDLNTIMQDRASQSAPAEVIELGKNAQARGGAALNAADSVLANEPRIASGIITAAHEVGRAVDQQITQSTPNLQAFLDASQSVFLLGQSFGKVGATPKLTTPSPVAPPGAMTSEAKNAAERIKVAVQAVNDAADAIEKESLNYPIADASTCPAQARVAAAKQLTFAPPSDGPVTLVQNQPYQIVVSGGQPSYQGIWVGLEPPPGELLYTRGGDYFRFEQKAPLSKDYIFVIRDAVGAEKSTTFKK